MRGNASPTSGPPRCSSVAPTRTTWKSVQSPHVYVVQICQCPAGSSPAALGTDEMKWASKASSHAAIDSGAPLSWAACATAANCRRLPRAAASGSTWLRNGSHKASSRRASPPRTSWSAPALPAWLRAPFPVATRIAGQPPRRPAAAPPASATGPAPAAAAAAQHRAPLPGRARAWARRPPRGPLKPPSEQGPEGATCSESS
mmetsp:Transcript_59593/g.192901  ORF Transcript_59593/g.192901 Transcript_59593/m.192901 type:complete len:202 (-) Transcript_59593:491-1096(-)